MTITLDPKTILSGDLDIISSKSDIHRCIICAAFADKETEIEFCGLSKDILTTIECVRALGAKAQFFDKRVKITPTDKDEMRQGLVLDCNESGTTARFLLPIAALKCRSCVLVGEGRLPERPFSELCTSLEEHGAQFSSAMLPITINKNIVSGEDKIYRIPGNISSQYISGLLLMLVLSDGGRVELTTPLESVGYVDMTIYTLKSFGVTVNSGENWYEVPSGQSFVSPGKIKAQGDWSSAAFWLCADALGANINISGLDENCPQGDRAVVALLEKFGATVQKNEKSLSLQAGRLKGIEIDAKNVPDLVPVLSAVACGAKGRTKIYGAARLRLKESDRIESTAQMLRSLGADVETFEDGLVINGKGYLDGGIVDGCNDHRIVMSAAIASLVCKKQVMIQGAQAVEKSYTTFFGDFDMLTMKK